MSPRFLLDTHILLRWLKFPAKLSREQSRTLRELARRGEPFAISAMTLLEIALLFGIGKARTGLEARELLNHLETHPTLRVLPITVDIAAEVAACGAELRDPADRAIVATARVHRLRLLTSDQRIIESGLVAVLE